MARRAYCPKRFVPLLLTFLGLGPSRCALGVINHQNNIRIYKFYSPYDEEVCFCFAIFKFDLYRWNLWKETSILFGKLRAVFHLFHTCTFNLRQITAPHKFTSARKGVGLIPRMMWGRNSGSETIPFNGTLSVELIFCLSTLKSQ